MHERLERVAIDLSRGPIVISWGSREKLLERMDNLAQADRATRAFKGAGASAPVQLTGGDKRTLLDVIDVWMGDLAPDDIIELGNALLDDLADTSTESFRPIWCDECGSDCG